MLTEAEQAAQYLREFLPLKRSAGEGKWRTPRDKKLKQQVLSAEQQARKAEQHAKRLRKHRTNRSDKMKATMDRPVADPVRAYDPRPNTPKKEVGGLNNMVTFKPVLFRSVW